MPLKKRSRVSNICNQRSNTARKRIKRDNESEEHKVLRLERLKTETAAMRSIESEEERVLRLGRKRTATAAMRSKESEEERVLRLERLRTGTAAMRSIESEDHRVLRLGRGRAANAASRSKKWDDLTRIALNYQASTGNYDHPSLRINSMTKICTFCKAKKFELFCCSGGKVILESFPAPPPLFQELLYGESPMSKQFLAKIMEYNGCFSMTSFGHQDASVQGWNPSFRIQGQVIINYKNTHNR